MATLADSPRMARNDDMFFLFMTLLVAATIVTGFSFHLAMGRSTFASPVLVHVHAITFMGWVGIFVLQSWFATRGPIALHRRLGWLATGWIAWMVVVGISITIFNVRQMRAPFFIHPAQFLILDPGLVLGFAALMAAGIANRRRTEWHRRLNLCAFALLATPGISRLTPGPLLAPYAFEVAVTLTLIFPIIGMIADKLRDGQVHPAWYWGTGAIVTTVLLVDAIAYSRLGVSLYHAATAGSPGASVAPYASFPAMPPG